MYIYVFYVYDKVYMYMYILNVCVCVCVYTHIYTYIHMYNTIKYNTVQYYTHAHSHTHTISRCITHQKVLGFLSSASRSRASIHIFILYSMILCVFFITKKIKRSWASPLLHPAGGQVSEALSFLQGSGMPVKLGLFCMYEVSFDTLVCQ